MVKRRSAAGKRPANTIANHASAITIPTAIPSNDTMITCGMMRMARNRIDSRPCDAASSTSNRTG